MKRKERATRISAGEYLYRGFELRCHGYYPPDRCVWWEASEGNEGAFHATTKRALMAMIDEDLARELRQNQLQDAKA